MSTHAHFAGELGTKRRPGKSLQKNPIASAKYHAEKLESAVLAHDVAKNRHTASLIRARQLLKSASSAGARARQSSNAADIEKWRVASARAVRAREATYAHAEYAKRAAVAVKKATLAHALAGRRLHDSLRDTDAAGAAAKRETATVVSRPDFTFSHDMGRIHGADEHPQAESFLEKSARLRAQHYGDQSVRQRSASQRAARPESQAEKLSSRRVGGARVATSRRVDVESLPGVRAISLPPARLHPAASAVSLSLTRERRAEIVSKIKEASRREISKLFVGRMW